MSALKILTGKPTGKRPLGRPQHRWEGYIRMDLKEIGVSARNWVDSAQDRNYWKAMDLVSQLDVYCLYERSLLAPEIIE